MASLFSADEIAGVKKRSSIPPASAPAAGRSLFGPEEVSAARPQATGSVAAAKQSLFSKQETQQAQAQATGSVAAAKQSLFSKQEAHEPQTQAASSVAAAKQSLFNKQETQAVQAVQEQAPTPSAAGYPPQAAPEAPEAAEPAESQPADAQGTEGGGPRAFFQKFGRKSTGEEGVAGSLFGRKSDGGGGFFGRRSTQTEEVGGTTAASSFFGRKSPQGDDDSGGGGGLFRSSTGALSTFRRSGVDDDQAIDPAAPVPRARVPSFEPGSAGGSAEVKDPRKEGTIQKYITYSVAGRLGNESYISRKRYSDFEWLRAALVQAFPGVFVPGLPVKKGLGRFEDSFVEDRRVGLEEFLERLFKRPGFIVQSELLRAFLKSNGEGSMEALKKAVEGNSMFDTYGVYREAVTPLVPANETCDLDSLGAFLDKEAAQLREAVEALTTAATAQRTASAAQEKAVKRVQTCVGSDARSLEAARAPAEMRGAFKAALDQQLAVTVERPSASLEVLLAGVERELADCEAMSEAIKSVGALERRIQEVKKKVEQQSSLQSRLLQQVQPGMAAAPAPEAPQMAQATPSKADQFRNSVSSITSGKIQIGKGDPMKQLDEIRRDLEHNTQDSSIGDEWLTAARTVCQGQEAALFMHIKAATQRWSQTTFATHAAEASAQAAAVWRPVANMR